MQPSALLLHGALRCDGLRYWVGGVGNPSPNPLPQGEGETLETLESSTGGCLPGCLLLLITLGYVGGSMPGA